MREVNDLTTPQIKSVMGEWFPRKAKMAFPPKKKYNRLKDGKTYEEMRFALPDGRKLGLYLRNDFERNDAPPIFVISGGLGFGGPVSANRWRDWLQDWNPIIVDTRGAGHSVPLGDPNITDNSVIVDDLDHVMSAFGIRQTGIIGNSYAGSLAFLMAERMLRTGRHPTFLASIAPTLCTTDRNWCFSSNAIKTSVPEKYQPDAWQRWEALTSNVESGSNMGSASLLSAYVKAFRSGDTDRFLDAFVAMSKWEDIPYRFYGDGFTSDSVKAVLQKGLREDRTVEDLLQAFMKGRLDPEDYLRDFDEEKNTYRGQADFDFDKLRKDLRECRKMVRLINHIMLWTEAWSRNCGFDEDSGIAPTIAYLRDNFQTQSFVAINSRDPLLPAGQQADYQSLWPDATRVFDSNQHGWDDVGLAQELFHWLEERRIEAWTNNDAQTARDRNFDLLRDLKTTEQLLPSEPERAAEVLAMYRTSGKESVREMTCMLQRGDWQAAFQEACRNDPAVALEANRLRGILHRRTVATFG